MSSKLLGIGFDCVMGSRSRKLVLLKLIDACRDDGTKIFPAVSTIARAAECSSRQVQRELALFVSVGLLALVKQGGKGRRSTNEYTLNVEMLRQIELSDFDTVVGVDGNSKGDTMSPLEKDGKGDTGGALRVTPLTRKGDNVSHPTPKEPLNDPSKRAPVRAKREVDSKKSKKGESTLTGPDREKLERRFWNIARNHPKSSGVPKQPWLNAWLALTSDEQDRAERRHSVWLARLKADGKDHVYALSTYFESKLFDQVDDPKPESPATVLVKPFGKLWGAYRLSVLLKGPEVTEYTLTAFEKKAIADGTMTRQQILLGKQVHQGWPLINRMDDAAVSRRSWSLLPDEAERLEQAAMTGIKVPQPGEASELWSAWQKMFAANGWPWLPDTGSQPYVWMPDGGPDNIDAFQEAIKQSPVGQAAAE